MSDISELSEQEKNGLLANLFNLPIEPHPVYGMEQPLIQTPPGLFLGWELFGSFYDFENLELAFWALSKLADFPDMAPKIYRFWKSSYWIDDYKLFLFSMHPKKLQLMILDKILELAIEDDLV